MKKARLSFLPAVVAGFATMFGAGVAMAQQNLTSDQDLYVSNAGNNTLAIINSAGTTVIGNSNYLSTPEGLAFDGQGNLYIANYGTFPDGGYIEKYNLSTQTFSTFATGLANPAGLAFDSQGNLFVANYIGGSITEFASGSNVGTTFKSGLVTPDGIAIDQFGDLYVGLGTGLDKIARIDPSGGTTVFSTTGTQLGKPIGVTFGPNGDLFVVNHSTPSVEEITINLNGTTFISSNPANGLNDPIDLAFDENGNLYVTDNGNDTVTEYNSSGVLINTFSSGAICGPTFLALAPGDSLPVPEPSTYALMLGGLAALYFFQRRRQASPARI